MTSLAGTITVSNPEEDSMISSNSSSSSSIRTTIISTISITKVDTINTQGRVSSPRHRVNSLNPRQ
jgi:hypothetical protein